MMFIVQLRVSRANSIMNKAELVQLIHLLSLALSLLT